jgi:hypothetical protein
VRTVLPFGNTGRGTAAADRTVGAVPFLCFARFACSIGQEWFRHSSPVQNINRAFLSDVHQFGCRAQSSDLGRSSIWRITLLCWNTLYVDVFGCR